MHKAALAAIVATLLAVGAEAQPERSIEFTPPAQAGPDVWASNTTWALLVFDSSGQASFDLDFPAPSVDHNTTIVSARTQDPTVFGQSSRLTEAPIESTRQQDAFKAQASYQGIGSLYLHGKSIHIQVQGTRADLQPQPTNCLKGLLPASERILQEARYDELCPGKAVAAVLRAEQPALSVQITATGLDAVEWHHANILCLDAVCPDGGQRSSSTTLVPYLNLNVTANTYGYHQLTSQDAALHGAGQAARILLGGSDFDFGVHGWVRLPLARTDACASCITAENQTFNGQGNITLAGLHRQEDRLIASMGGTLTAARIDEQQVSAAFLAGVSLGTTVAAVGIFWLLLALFSRLRRAELPERRRAILQAIEGTPGLSTADLAKQTGFLPDLVRYHLDLLRRGGYIIERRQGRTPRFFENHGRFGDEAKALAALHDGWLRQLHDWLLVNPGISADHLAQHAKATWGWSRSTTYHRLRRLSKAGLVVRSPGHRSILQALQVPVRAARPTATDGPPAATVQSTN